MNKSRLAAKWQERKDVYEAYFNKLEPDMQELVKETFNEKIIIFSEIINDLKNITVETVKFCEICPDCNGYGYYINGVYAPNCSNCDGTGAI